jgi:hypothetical protein
VSKIHGQIFIAQPAEAVFDFVADERNEPRYNSRMTRMVMTTPEPIHEGSRFAGSVKSRGRDLDLTLEFTEFQRPVSLRSRTVMSSNQVLGGLTFEQVNGGTVMSWSWEIRLSGFTQLFTPLVGRLGKRQELGIWTNLKDLLENTDLAPGNQ